VSNPYLSDVFEDVSEEGQRAREKFGEQRDLNDLHWLAILGEEFGEVARHVTQTRVPPITHREKTPTELRAELVQVAAVAMRWVQVIDGRRDHPYWSGPGRIGLDQLGPEP
jgi:hypothetical protein